MDKSDLEDLLVKLKLETVTVDDAIDELRSISFKRGARTQSIPAIFKNCIFAKNMSVEHLSSVISSFIATKSDFILLGVDEKKASELLYGNDELTYSMRASVLYHVKSSAKKNKRKILVVASQYADEKVVNEVLCLADIFGFDATYLPGITLSNIKTFNEYNSSKILATLLITGNDYALETLISNDTVHPIISIRNSSDSVENIAADIAGVISVDSKNAFKSFPILFRVTDKK